MGMMLLKKKFSSGGRDGSNNKALLPNYLILLKVLAQNRNAKTFCVL